MLCDASASHLVHTPNSSWHCLQHLLSKINEPAPMVDGKPAFETTIVAVLGAGGSGKSGTSGPLTRLCDVNDELRMEVYGHDSPVVPKGAPSLMTLRAIVSHTLGSPCNTIAKALLQKEFTAATNTYTPEAAEELASRCCHIHEEAQGTGGHLHRFMASTLQAHRQSAAAEGHPHPELVSMLDVLKCCPHAFFADPQQHCCKDFGVASINRQTGKAVKVVPAVKMLWQRIEEILDAADRQGVRHVFVVVHGQLRMKGTLHRISTGGCVSNTNTPCYFSLRDSCFHYRLSCSSPGCVSCTFCFSFFVISFLLLLLSLPMCFLQ